MKCNPIRWLWGILPVAALAVLAAYWERSGIEVDLEQRVAERLSGTGLSWAKSEFSGRDGAIIGRASDDDDPQRAMDLGRSVWGVRQLRNATELIEKAETYQWMAARTGGRVVVRGLVPNEATRRTILGLARTQIPDGDVVDEMRLARGVPALDTWQTGIRFALKQLGGLKSGEVRLDGLALALSGEAATSASFRLVRSALQSELPRGISLRDARITPPVVSPYTWAARYSGSELILGGYVPDDRVRAQLLTQARALPRSPRVVDRMEIGGGAPSGFAAAATLGLRELARLEDGSASLRDATVSVDGMAPDEQAAVAARRELRSNMPPGMRFSDQIRFREPPPPPPPPVAISPYTGGIDVDDARVLLSGHVPSVDVQSALTQSARTRFPGRQIDNRLVVGAGAPDEWQRCFEGALIGLARLGSGRAQLVDKRMELISRTEDEDLAAAMPGTIRTALQGACESNVRVDVVAAKEPERTWRAAYDGTTVVLGGEVTSEPVRQALLQQARRQFRGNVRVVDEMRVVDNRSRNWPRAAEAGLAALKELERGEVVLESQRLTLSGVATFDDRLIERVRGEINRALPRGYTSRDQISMSRPTQTPPSIPVTPPIRPLTREADLCQTTLREAARAGVINFERARADLTSDSTQTLDRIAQLARQCPRVRIEIEGHTDAEGTPERNQRLSDRRATAVQQYLTRAGVANDMLKAIGYGETRPIAPNDTADNRARNRRIEFTVVE